MTQPEKPATPREWIGLAVLALPTLLVSMDMTILYLALPAVSAQLHPGGAQLLWISDIYAFVLAGVLIPMGALGDRVGRRRLLLGGSVGFGAASVLAGLSSSPEQLIAARALLGVAGATLLPSTLAMIRSMFPVARERTLAIGIWATCFTLGGVMGPLVGGALLSHFHWGSVFFAAVPVMLAVLVAGPALLPEVREPFPGRVDLASVALLMAAVLGATFAMKHMAEHGLTWVSCPILLGALLAGAHFMHRQQQIPNPLVDPGLFRSRAFAMAIAANASALFAWVGASLLVAQHLQLALALPPMSAAYWTLPGAVACVAGCLLAPVLANRWWSGRIVTLGLALSATGLAVLAALGAQLGLAAIVPGTMILGFGVSLVVTLCTDLIMGAAPPGMAGSASSLSETAADLGGALGVAVLGSIALAVYRGAASDGLGVAAGAACLMLLAATSLSWLSIGRARSMKLTAEVPHA